MKRYVRIWNNNEWIHDDLINVRRGDIFQLYSSKGIKLDMSHRGHNITYGLAIFNAVKIDNDDNAEIFYEPMADIKEAGKTIEQVLMEYPENHDFDAIQCNAM